MRINRKDLKDIIRPIVEDAVKDMHDYVRSDQLKFKKENDPNAIQPDDDAVEKERYDSLVNDRVNDETRRLGITEEITGDGWRDIVNQAYESCVEDLMDIQDLVDMMQGDDPKRAKAIWAAGKQLDKACEALRKASR